eukprot:638593-Pyramimonas_sp.AAC.1
MSPGCRRSDITWPSAWRCSTPSWSCCRRPTLGHACRCCYRSRCSSSVQCYHSSYFVTWGAD